MEMPLALYYVQSGVLVQTSYTAYLHVVINLRGQVKSHAFSHE